MDNSNSDWYHKAKQELVSQKKIICDAVDKEMPDRYRQYCQIESDLEKLENWERALVTSSSPGP